MEAEIQIHILGIDEEGNQIDEVCSDIDSALDYLEELKERIESTK